MMLPILAAMMSAQVPTESAPFVFVGTYTKPPSEGIYSFRFDLKTGHPQLPLTLAAKVANPSFLAIHPNGKILYAVSEESVGSVTAFTIDREHGTLTELNHAPTKGDGPCHLNVASSGKFLIAVNYGSGSVTRIPIESDGRLGQPSVTVQHQKPTGGAGTDASRQAGPHAHSVNFSPDGSFAFVADLGRDEVITYRVDHGGLDPVEVTHLAPGSGPRHLSFHPSGKMAYVINELASTVTAFTYDAHNGTLKEIQTISTMPPDFKGKNYPAEVLVHPSGKFLYGSNRGHNSLSIFSIDGAGKLHFVGTEPTRGEWPRNFTFDPTGHFLLNANQNSNTITVYKIDEKTGKLAPLGDPISVGSPVCLRFLH